MVSWYAPGSTSVGLADCCPTCFSIFDLTAIYPGSPAEDSLGRRIHKGYPSRWPLVEKYSLLTFTPNGKDLTKREPASRPVPSRRAARVDASDASLLVDLSGQFSVRFQCGSEFDEQTLARR